MTTRQCWFAGLGLALTLASGPALASPCDIDIRVQFIEGAPSDRFEIVNQSRGSWVVGALTIDLGTSEGRLFFDTEEGGAGVQVYSPFAGDAGPVRLRRVTELRDGGTRITLDFDEMQPGDGFAFSIDLDDPSAQSALGPTQIAGHEIRGADTSAVIRAPNGTLVQERGRFGDDDVDTEARITPAWCRQIS